jgi:hypothetical protein
MKLVADSLPNTEKINDLIQEFGIKKTEIVLLDKNAPLSKRFIWFNQKKIVFFDEALSRLNPSKKFDADIIVLAVQNHAVQKPFSTHYNAPLYLIGPSLSAAKTKQWLQGLPTQNCIDIKKSGCFYLFPN